MIKVCVTERNNLNEKIIERDKDIVLVNNPYEADFLISQSTIRFPDLLHKTIYLTGEAPRSDHRKWCFSNFDNMHTVCCFNPDSTKPNQFGMVCDDQYQFYPTRADPYPFITRENTKLKNRGVYYAGMINVYENTTDTHGGINITPLRKLLGNYFLNTEPFNKDSIIVGIGWHGQQTKRDLWRKEKIEEIGNSNCDFVLAMENTIYPNYLYEKIWDGFASDRVTLYLGDPNISRHIPLNCFIDLRLYFNTKTKEFDLDRLGKKLKEMTQEEYDTILNNARKFRETSKDEFRKHMDSLTNFVIRRMKNGETKFEY